jgi:hypothetical protein
MRLFCWDEHYNRGGTAFISGFFVGEASPIFIKNTEYPLQIVLYSVNGHINDDETFRLGPLFDQATAGFVWV